jgi:hypothetical protein
MLLRMITHGQSFPFSAINPSVIGRKVIVRNKSVDDHHNARLLTVSSYVIKDDRKNPGHKKYFLNESDDFGLKETDLFTPVTRHNFEDGYAEYLSTSFESLAVKDAGIDLVGNIVTFKQYRHETNISMPGEITGFVVGVYQKDDMYTIELASEKGGEHSFAIKAHANNEIVV